MDKIHKVIQPISYSDDGTNICYGSLPDELLSFQAFCDRDTCYRWLKNHGYEPDGYVFLEYDVQDIEDVQIIDDYGNQIN